MKQALTKISLAVLTIVMVQGCSSNQRPTTQTSQVPEGFPETDAQTVYDEYDFQRATQAYLWAMPLVSVSAMVEAWKKDGATMQNLPIYAGGAQPDQVVLTSQSQSIYVAAYLDLSDGPIVIEAPPGGLGGFNNAWERTVVDIGPFGPDKSKGGKFLILPPGYEGEVPEGYFTAQSDTYWILWLVRGTRVDGKAAPAVAQLKQYKLYPLSSKENPPAMSFYDGNKVKSDMVFKNGMRYWETLHRAIQREPVRDHDKAMLGFLASLGIEKGKPFNPSARNKAILERAEVKGLEMARTIAFDSRSPRATIYEGKQWERIFVADDVSFHTPTYLDTESRVTYVYPACWTSPGMTLEVVGAGSQYASATKDANGKWLDGAKNYSLHLDPNIPAKNFWSVMVYDAISRSMVNTDQKMAGLDSYGDLQKNSDGSIDLYFGPKAPEGKKSNWIKTLDDRGFFLYFRWYGPTQEFFDQSWQLNDIIEVK